MSEKELNEKLAKWAGFTIRDYPEPKVEPNEKAWYDPLGQFYSGLNNFINFPNSLDTCFKWLVPKILDGRDIDLANTSEGYAFCIIDDMGETCCGDKSPALALCRAIEKLVGKEV